MSIPCDTLTLPGEATLLSSGGEKRKERTLARLVTRQGIGLFTGKTAQISLVPAEAGSGILFRRMDLPLQPCVPARVEAIHSTPRCTVLEASGVKVQLVEHLLSALRAFQIDNLVIETSGEEIPVFDGSALPFVEMIEEAGVEEQDRFKQVRRLRSPLYWSKENTHLVALPSDLFRVSYMLQHAESRVLGTQFYSFVVNQKDYTKEIAPARTFSIYEEIAPLIQKGMVKGGSLENAVVIKEDRVLNREGVRYPDEMVRHKVLDLIGDLSLLSSPLLTHVIAIRSGHASNCAFARMLEQEIRRERGE